MGNKKRTLALIAVVAGEDVRPTGEGGCSDECPSYDGKRCRLTGCRERSCVPAWGSLLSEVERLRAAAAPAAGDARGESDRSTNHEE